ncbi:MAG TPA: AAA family ATPase [Candidatus Avalokitesvara rifleensis]|uniref:AAA family ATPase n=1 Tax=Candidatus Avalokitesvara rifleensis TaxID=3367620 RepID=UPI0027143EAF|nr:AAA family ATPase [Candidatus Brocadiales bacterium]
MLTKFTAKNFKRFDKIEVELGDPVVFIGPNNSGKTSALQALVLWEIGLKRWIEKRKGQKTPAPEKRPGVTINRRDLVAIPIPAANLLWRDLHVRNVQRVDGKPKTDNVYIDLIMEGITKDKSWQCGLEFYYANEESFYCRPIRMSEDKKPDRMPIPKEAEEVHLAFLPPMSGLAANETRLDPGAINVRIGEGRTAEVLRNLCHNIFKDKKELWGKLTNQINSLFGSELGEPKYIGERGEIVMNFRERGIRLDFSSSGRGLQQTLLLLAYMYANPNAVLLLDEPDAHLEILRQRQIYQLLIDVARQNNNQIIAASHSEVLLNEAADRDVVVAFVGKPHRIDDRGSQVRKALIEIGFEDYYQAEQTGWVLYLEGATDLATLRAFAEMLKYDSAIKALERPFVHYVGNQPTKVSNHFYGLREAVSYLKGIAIFDRLDQNLSTDLGAKGLMWKRKEIENYMCYPEVLVEYARATAIRDTAGPLFSSAECSRRVEAMEESIKEIQQALEKLGKGSPWDKNLKVSDEFLTPLFENYFKKLGLLNVMAKKNFHELARLVPIEMIDPEVKDKLDAIVEICEAQIQTVKRND